MKQRKPRDIVGFEGGPWDGLQLPWPSHGPDWPVQMWVEYPVYDREVVPGASVKEEIGVAMAAKVLALKCHLYEVSNHGTAYDAEGNDLGEYAVYTCTRTVEKKPPESP